MTTSSDSPHNSPHKADDSSAEVLAKRDAFIMETVGYPFLTRLYAEADDPKVADLLDRMGTLHNGGDAPVMKEFVGGSARAAAWVAYQYASRVAGEQVPELELLIMCSDIAVMSYARDVIRDRWPAGEHVLLASDQSVLLHDYVTLVR